MMEGFVRFVIAFCSACIVMGGLGIIAPTGAIKSSVRYIFSLIFLCVILSAGLGAAKFKPDFSLFNDVSVEKYDINDTVVRQVFEQALKDAGIEYERITVSLKKNSDESVTVERVLVYTSEDPQIIKKVIGETDDYEVVVISE